MPVKKLLFLNSFLLVVCLAVAQQKNALPRSTPEAEGVSSGAIIDFLDEASKSKHEFHSIMIVRNGKVVAEGWWNPYKPDLRHTMYSVSKSFTATAVGFAVTEKKISLDDKVIKFFPEFLPDTVNENLAALTIKDLLTMSVGQDPDPSTVVPGDTNWIKRFLKYPVIYKPGSRFLYNSMGTYMLSAIVQKVTGQKIIDYLRPRLFVPLGIEGADWETDPKGINVGGWGLRVKTEDMAKFGLLFLQKGQWQGKQVLPASWVEEASTTKIMQNPLASEEEKASNDWLQGYCYQMWRCRNNAYRADGAFGQYIFVMPDQGAVIAITAETIDMQGIINMVWKHLLPAFKNDKLPIDASTSQLKKKLASLALPLPSATTDSVARPTVKKQTYRLTENERGYKQIAFDFNGKNCRMLLTTAAGTFPLSFSSGGWTNGSTAKLGPSLVAMAKNHFGGLPPSKIRGSFVWKDASTAQFILRYIESPHTETFTCQFSGDNISIDIQNSFEKNKRTPTITGTKQ